MKNIIFFTLSFIWLIFFTSCEKNLEKWEEISKNSEINFFEWENFLANSFVPDWETKIETQQIYSEFKNKWFRDCTEEDFKCAWAEDDCQFWLWQNVWWCRFWCWAWNDEVQLRKDLYWKQVRCNYIDWDGAAAKSNVAAKCWSLNYATWWTVFDNNSSYGTNCIDSAWNCWDGTQKICKCWPFNKWLINWNILKSQCSEEFCSTEGIEQIDTTTIDTKVSYFLEKCTWEWYELYWRPDDSELWLWWFNKIITSDNWELTCEWDYINNTKIFYADALSVWNCAYTDFSCKKLIKNSWVWVWIWSSDTKSFESDWNTYKNTEFKNTLCLVEKSKRLKHSKIKLCEEWKESNCKWNWETINIDSSKLAFSISWDQPWFYRLYVDEWDWEKIIWEIETKEKFDNFSNTNIIWDYNMGNEKDWWKKYNVRIVPACYYTIWEKTDQKKIYSWDEWAVDSDCGIWITVTFSWATL
jgi:hypothetical protein